MFLKLNLDCICLFKLKFEYVQNVHIQLLLGKTLFFVTLI